MTARPGGPKTDRQTARERRALRLRIVGQKTYGEIARSLMPCDLHVDVGGINDCPLCEPLYSSRSGAMRAVKRALLRDFPGVDDDERDAYISEQLATISQIVARMMLDLMGAPDAVDRARAARTILTALARQANLLGLDANRRELADDDLDAWAAQLVEELTVTASQS